MQPISEIIKQAAILLRLEEPSGTLTTSTNIDIKLLLQCAKEIGEGVRDKDYPQLKKHHSFTTGAADTQYPMPTDFYRMVEDTQWDNSSHWKLNGPDTDQMWNYYQFGIVAPTSRKRFRVFGANELAGQFFLYPPPDAGQVISFDYIRSAWFLPKLWTAGEGVTNGVTYRSSSGNIYLAQTTASTGATAPSHTTGTASDGTVSWLYVADQIYSSTGRFIADTDYSLVDDELMRVGTMYKFQQASGLDYGERQAEFEKKLADRVSRMQGAPILSMANDGVSKFLSYDNIPESDLG